MFLYKQPNIQYIKRLYYLLNDYDFIKLIKTGVNNGIEIGKNLYQFRNTPFDYFAIQPSIWKTKILLDIFKNTVSETIWQFEISAGNYCLENNIKGVYCYDKNNDKPRGGHFDSSIYPYIATAIVKGKWNYKEYESELKDIFNKHSYEPKREILWRKTQ